MIQHFLSLIFLFWFCNATCFYSGFVIKPPQPSSAIYGAPPFTGNLILAQSRTSNHSVFKKRVTTFKNNEKKFSKNVEKQKRGFSLPWSPLQDYNDQKRVPTLIKPAQQVKLTVFSKKRSYAKNVIFSGFSTKN